MQTTLNRSTGSLFTGAQRLENGDLIQLESERHPRRVTYVMGSAAKGWHACFRWARAPCPPAS